MLAAETREVKVMDCHRVNLIPTKTSELCWASGATSGQNCYGTSEKFLPHS